MHGILVQLPLPRHIDASKVIEAIAPAKDVDGFHVASAGALMTGQPGFWPCTPYGCMKMLESIGYDLRGKHAVVIGRSNIVGKPMALMLLQKNATVTICHSATRDLKALTLQADVVVAAVGKRNVLTADMVKPGAVVIDVGMNRNDEGKLCGDVDFAGVKEVAGWITPVPGGVGPDDPRHAAGQHAGSGRARSRLIGISAGANPVAPLKSAGLPQNGRHDQSPSRLPGPSPFRPDPAGARGSRHRQPARGERSGARNRSRPRLSGRLARDGPACWTAPPSGWAAPGVP